MDEFFVQNALAKSAEEFIQALESAEKHWKAILKAQEVLGTTQVRVDTLPKGWEPDRVTAAIAVFGEDYNKLPTKHQIDELKKAVDDIADANGEFWRGKHFGRLQTIVYGLADRLGKK